MLSDFLCNLAPCVHVNILNVSEGLLHANLTDKTTVRSHLWRTNSSVTTLFTSPNSSCFSLEKFCIIVIKIRERTETKHNIRSHSCSGANYTQADVSQTDVALPRVNTELLESIPDEVYNTKHNQTFCQAVHTHY